ncbi:asparagine synthase (glutamine-hydrolyzing) [Ruminococcus sp. 210702-SL.1.03]|uniref:asparagine synthase (glutamine-hydrolyzing) n=1 Tax=Ruminococcus sp. 210702-SL.1.03 TaxID=2883233 RepID=UPI001D0970D2|nr:asparagine synthase (glutamine-hydrolyzing) [Ruminococcus sp. 210702-SL.1.03]MCB6615265.1 asparagine synthase (glutamine-hydrolyzing) [Ruminococcus sp. 210702-SL.1.03]
MCAISGIIRFGGLDTEPAAAARKMAAVLKRRGPDDDGYYISPKSEALLVHTRLAVIDPENGAQPMLYAEGGRRLALVYNGELYNTAELRALLEARGHKFSTNTDTEAVLRAYAEWGADCLSRMNGIFAFAVWDEAARSLFIARDRIGVKPFYYTLYNGALYFASEIKGLLSCGVPAELDAEGVREIMLLGPAIPCGSGVFKGVFELKPAECAVYDERGLRKHIYWDYGCEGGTNESFDEVKEHVRSLVTDAITRQTVSDVPLCTFLSGGLDSSLISSVTARRFAEQGRRLHTFSVEYRDNAKYFKAGKFQPNSDDEYIQIMAKYLGTEHHRVIIDTPELVEALYTSTEARDLPGMADVDSSLLLFCKKVREFSTVALSGECADEIFGGYPWYRDKDIRMTDGFPWSQSTVYRAGLTRREFVPNENAAQEYVYAKYLDTIGRAESEGLPPLEKRMREMMRLNMEWFMQTLLVRKDRMSMYWGLEVRVPFCDHRIVEYLYRVPWEYKDYLGREKGLLREAMSSWLPEEVLWRKKSPYPKTHNPSYTAAVRERLREELSQTRCPVLDILDRGEIERLMQHGDHVQWYGQLMNDPQIMAYIIQINHWLKINNIALV